MNDIVCWTPPQADSYKCNVDAVFFFFQDTICTGFILCIRDDRGAVIIGRTFSCNTCMSVLEGDAS